MNLYPGSLTDVPGLSVGHYDDQVAGTGVTVVLPALSALAAVDIRGGAPGTLGTAALQPTATNSAIHGLVLTGRSLFGLPSTFGVMRYLEEQGRGIQRRNVVIPIVPAAVIYDFIGGNSSIRPTEEWGYRAAALATTVNVPVGNVGVGTGARVGKWVAGLPLKGGLGMASISLLGDVVVAALVVVNALGDVVDPQTGLFYCHAPFDPFILQRVPSFNAGPGYLRPGLIDAPFPHELLRQNYSLSTNVPSESLPFLSTENVPLQQSAYNVETDNGDIGQNTTLAVVATNALLDKTQLAKVAQMTHDGFARAIHPVHATGDGDVVFALSVGGDERKVLPTDRFTTVDVIGTAAADIVTAAIVNALLSARSAYGWLAYQDWLALPK